MKIAICCKKDCKNYTNNVLLYDFPSPNSNKFNVTIVERSIINCCLFLDCDLNYSIFSKKNFFVFPILKEFETLTYQVDKRQVQIPPEILLIQKDLDTTTPLTLTQAKRGEAIEVNFKILDILCKLLVLTKMNSVDRCHEIEF